MNDEAKPRVRGQKDIEAAYRRGFLDGVQHGLDEVKRAREIEQEREAALGIGFLKYGRERSLAPRRTRKKRGNPDVSLDAAQAGNL